MPSVMERKNISIIELANLFMLKILKQLEGNPWSPLSPLCCELNKQWSAALVQRYFNPLILATGWCTLWLGPLRMHYVKFAGKGNNPFIVVFFLFTALLLPSLAYIMLPSLWNLQIWSHSGLCYRQSRTMWLKIANYLTCHDVLVFCLIITWLHSIVYLNL